jgi:hypothetical protein
MARKKTARRPRFTQLAFDFDPATVRQPVRAVLPPGLREVAVADGLDDEQVRQLAEMWHTIRGQKPKTVEEWRNVIWLLKPIFAEW